MFADLDSPDPGTQAAALLKVGAVGVGVAIPAALALPGEVVAAAGSSVIAGATAIAAGATVLSQRLQGLVQPLARAPAPAVARSGSGVNSGAALARAGLSAEERVSAAISVARDVGPGRVTVPGSGPGGFRVPDFPPAATIAARGTIVEVKDVAELTATPQLRDLVANAAQEGVRLEIFTNARIPASGRLADWIKEQLVIIQRIPR